jgi:hypothetical protein
MKTALARSCGKRENRLVERLDIQGGVVPGFADEMEVNRAAAEVDVGVGTAEGGLEADDRLQPPAQPAGCHRAGLIFASDLIGKTIDEKDAAIVRRRACA